MNREQIYNEFAKYVEADDKYYTHSKHGIIEDVLAWLNIASSPFVGANSYVHAQNLEKLHNYLMNSATEEQLRQVYDLTKGMDLPKHSPVAESAGKVFVSMPMNKTKCEYVDDIRKGVEAAIVDSGHEPYFLDKDVHNENIVNKMFEEIVACKFLVADLTSQNTGVYYEAGYAKAIGKTVIFTCNSNDFENVHFDVKQTQIVIWDNSDDLHVKLAEHIKRSDITNQGKTTIKSNNHVNIDTGDELHNKVLKELLEKIKLVNDSLLFANRAALLNPGSIMLNLEVVKEKVFDVVVFKDTNSADIKSLEKEYSKWVREWDSFVDALKPRVNKPLTRDDQILLGEKIKCFKDQTSNFITATRKQIS